MAVEIDSFAALVRWAFRPVAWACRCAHWWISFFQSFAGELMHRVDERHGHEDHSGQQGGDGDGDPHLLAALLDGLEFAALHLAAAQDLASAEMSAPRSLASQLSASTPTSRSTAGMSQRWAHSRRASISVTPWLIRGSPPEFGRRRAPPRPAEAADQRRPSE